MAKLLALPGLPVLTSEMVDALADFYAWAQQTPVTESDREELTRMLTECWQQHDLPSVENVTQALSLNDARLIPGVPDPENDRNQCQFWIWDVLASPKNLVFGEWGRGVGLRQPSSGEPGEPGESALDASDEAHRLRMKSLRNDWVDRPGDDPFRPR